MKGKNLFVGMVVAGLLWGWPVIAETGAKISSLMLLPWPQTVEDSKGDLVWSPVSGWRKKEAVAPPSPRDFQTRGDCRLRAGSRIVATELELVPLAKVLAAEIKAVLGRELPIVELAQPDASDIALQRNPGLASEQYVLEAERGVRITGGSYAATAMGTVTLLQALAETDDGSLALPVMTIRDAPSVPYRGLMVDVARNWHSIATLRQCVVLCRLYKINTLHLHLTDNESFTFPSRSFPQLCTAGRTYNLDELRGLVAFAKDRGVQILPEIEMPGHDETLFHSMPELFACKPPPEQIHRTICIGSEEVYHVFDTLLGEVAEVFNNTPYLHIGADEVNKEAWKGCRTCQAYRMAHGLENVEEMYRHFLVRMNGIVKKHGRRMIVWEGFAKEGRTEIPKDVTVMVFDSVYNTAPDLVSAGYSVINTSWKPLYVVGGCSWPAIDIYCVWDVGRFEHWHEKSKAYKIPQVVAPTPLLSGAQMCSWAQDEKAELPSLRRRVPAMGDRSWNAQNPVQSSLFEARLKRGEALLEKLLMVSPKK